MACIRTRRGRYVLDWRDEQTGRRKWRSFPLTEEGRAAAERALALVETVKPLAIDPTVAVGPYIEHWLRLARLRVSSGTIRSYVTIRYHVPPKLWKLRVADVTRPTLKAWASDLMARRAIGRATATRLLSIMRSVMAEAVDDGLLPHNPAMALGRSAGLGPKPRRGETVRQMDPDQLETFMAVARMVEPEHHARFAVLAYAGLRSGEARGLQAADIDFERGKLRVERQVYIYGGTGPTKSKLPRTVDLGDELAGILSDYVAARRAFDMRTGRRSPWLLFPELEPEPSRAAAGMMTKRVASAMAHVLSEAGLPDHFTPHCLRHTFATILLSHGESLLYVSRQLGDTLTMTAETYGSWAQVPPTAGGPNLMVRVKDEEKRPG